jgi:hypothetical protein
MLVHQLFFVGVLASLALADLKADLLLFRSIFRTYAQRAGITDDQVRQTILYPTPELLSVHTSSSLGAIEAAWHKSKASELYAAGASLPFSPVDVDGPLISRTKPLTIFLIGGMAGEMLPTVAFSQAYNAGSTLAKTYAARLAATPLTDSVWDLHAYNYLELPLSELVMASSVDDVSGKPLLNLVWLKAHGGSLESLIDSSVTVPIHMRRITKFLSLIGGAVDDFLLLGYSRGAVDGLEIMSTAQSSLMPWASRLRGLITLQGVLFGAVTADCISGGAVSNPASLCEMWTHQAETLRNITQQLVPSKLSFNQNTDILTSGLASLESDQQKKPAIPEMANTHMIYPDLALTWEQLFKNLLFETFDIWHPVTDYENNIRRFQAAAESLLDSLHLLSTPTRLRWWQTHTIPTDALYMSFSLSQADADVNLGEKLYPDIFMMRENYYSVVMTSGTELNDGQLETAHEIILNNVHMALNPLQGVLHNNHFVAVGLGDHWSSALSYVVPTPDNHTNPFPRVALLKSFATFAAMHL